MKKTNILYILALSIFFGCSTPKFYNEVKSTFVKPNNDIIKLQGTPNEKLVLKRLEQELKTTEHIILVYVPSTSFSNDSFISLVYDFDNRRYYYVDAENGKLLVKPEHINPKDDYRKFVLQKYLGGKSDYLKELGEVSNHSGVQTTEAIYDIDLKNNNVKKVTYKSFLFMNGKPTKDVNQ